MKYYIPCKIKKCISYPACQNKTHIDCEIIEKFMLECLDDYSIIDDLDFCKRFAVVESIIPNIQTMTIKSITDNNQVSRINISHIRVQYNTVLLTHNIKNVIINKGNKVRIIYANKSNIKKWAKKIISTVYKR